MPKRFNLEVHAFAGPSLCPEWSLNGTYIFERTCQVGSEDNSKAIPFRRASDCFSFLLIRESYSITASYYIIFDISTILKKFLLHRPTCFQRPSNCTASSSFNARTMSLWSCQASEWLSLDNTGVLSLKSGAGTGGSLTEPEVFDLSFSNWACDCHCFEHLHMIDMRQTQRCWGLQEWRYLAKVWKMKLTHVIRRRDYIWHSACISAIAAHVLSKEV